MLLLLFNIRTTSARAFGIWHTNPVSDYRQTRNLIGYVGWRHLYQSIFMICHIFYIKIEKKKNIMMKIWKHNVILLSGISRCLTARGLGSSFFLTNVKIARVQQWLKDLLSLTRGTIIVRTSIKTKIFRQVLFSYLVWLFISFTDLIDLLLRSVICLPLFEIANSRTIVMVTQDTTTLRVLLVLGHSFIRRLNG